MVYISLYIFMRSFHFRLGDLKNISIYYIFLYSVFINSVSVVDRIEISSLLSKPGQN